jgi:hypothetical protein
MGESLLTNRPPNRFILLFAVSMRISTTATRDSIFAATAAYAAVLIVFVSGDLGRANQS